MRAQLEAVTRLANGVGLPPIVRSSVRRKECARVVDDKVVRGDRSNDHCGNLFATRLTCLSIKI